MSGAAGTRSVVLRGGCLPRLALVCVICISRRACLHAAGWIARAEYAKVGVWFDRSASNSGRALSSRANATGPSVSSRYAARPTRVPRDRRRAALSTDSACRWIDGSFICESRPPCRPAAPSLTHCKTSAQGLWSPKPAGRFERPVGSCLGGHRAIRSRAARWSVAMPACDVAVMRHVSRHQPQRSVAENSQLPNFRRRARNPRKWVIISRFY